MQITAKRRIQRILKNVRKLSGNFGESREPVTRRSPAQRVGRNVEPFQVFPAWLHVLKHAHVFPQILQVLRGFLKKTSTASPSNLPPAPPPPPSSAFAIPPLAGSRTEMHPFKPKA